MKREMFGYVEGGYATILRRFEAHLESLGVESRYGCRVTEIWNGQDGADVHLASGEVCRFDRVIATIPCARIADLCPQLSEAERARLRGVTYQGIACAALLLKKPLADYYITNITESWVPFTAVIETTALVDRKHFGGKSLVYLPRYLTQEDPFWQKSDAEIEREFVAALERMYPHFRADDVITFQVSRVREMLAVSTLHYSDTLLPSTRTSLENVFVVNSAQIANGTLNVNETLGLAAAKAAELRPYLRTAAAVAAARTDL